MDYYLWLKSLHVIAIHALSSSTHPTVSGARWINRVRMREDSSATVPTGEELTR